MLCQCFLIKNCPGLVVVSNFSVKNSSSLKARRLRQRMLLPSIILMGIQPLFRLFSGIIRVLSSKMSSMQFQNLCTWVFDIMIILGTSSSMLLIIVPVSNLYKSSCSGTMGSRTLTPLMKNLRIPSRITITMLAKRYQIM